MISAGYTVAAVHAHMMYTFIFNCALTPSTSTHSLPIPYLKMSMPLITSKVQAVYVKYLSKCQTFALSKILFIFRSIITLPVYLQKYHHLLCCALAVARVHFCLN